MFAVLSLLLACSSGVSVTIDNQTGAPLTDVTVSVTGAERVIGEIPAGDQETVLLSPSGESSITVQGAGFEEGAGYIESGYRGEVTFTMKPDGEVIIEDETKLPWL